MASLSKSATTTSSSSTSHHHHLDPTGSSNHLGHHHSSGVVVSSGSSYEPMSALKKLPSALRFETPNSSSGGGGPRTPRGGGSASSSRSTPPPHTHSISPPHSARTTTTTSPNNNNNSTTSTSVISIAGAEDSVVEQTTTTTTVVEGVMATTQKDQQQQDSTTNTSMMFTTSSNITCNNIVDSLNHETDIAMTTEKDPSTTTNSGDSKLTPPPSTTTQNTDMIVESLQKDQSSPPSQQQPTLVKAKQSDDFVPHSLFTPSSDFIQMSTSDIQREFRDVSVATLPGGIIYQKNLQDKSVQEFHEQIRSTLCSAIQDPALKYITAPFLDTKPILTIQKQQQHVKNDLDWELENSSKVGLSSSATKQMILDSIGSSSSISNFTSAFNGSDPNNQGSSNVVSTQSQPVLRIDELTNNGKQQSTTPQSKKFNKPRSHTLGPNAMIAGNTNNNGSMTARATIDNSSSAPTNIMSPLVVLGSSSSVGGVGGSSQTSLSAIGTFIQQDIIYSSSKTSVGGFLLSNAAAEGINSDRRRSDVDLETTEVDFEEDEEEETFSDTDLNFREISEKIYEETTHRVASVYNPFFRIGSIEEEVCKRPQTPTHPHQPDQSFKVLISVNGLYLSTNTVLEPLYGSLYLYDKKKESRVSEEFKFTLNTDPNTLKQLGIEKTFPKDLIMVNDPKKLEAVFSLKEKNPNIYLVLWLRRIFSGGESGSIHDFYNTTTTSSSSSKNESILKKSITEKLKSMYAFLDHLRSPFLCSAEPLFEEKRESVTSNELKVNDTINESNVELSIRIGRLLFERLYIVPHMDGKKGRFNICRFIETQRELKQQKSNIRVDALSLKSIPGHFSVFMKNVTHENYDHYHHIHSLFNTGVHEIRPSIIVTTNSVDNSTDDNDNTFTFSDDDTCLSYNTFSQSSRGVALNSLVPRIDFNFSHVLYILPDCCNLTSLPSSFKSVAVKIFLRDNDELHNGGILVGTSTIFSDASRNYPGGMIMDDEAVTSVTYHERYPQFLDQIKIQLPLPVNSNHHLVFEFRHISTKRSLEMNGPLGKAETTVIGYSILKLIDDDGFTNGLKKLPIFKCTSLPNYYMSKGMQTYANGKTIFRFHLINKSSLYPPDKNSAMLIAKSNLLVDSQVPKATFLNELNKAFVSSECEDLLKMFQKTSWSLVLHHTPIVLNLIFYILSNLKASALSQSPSSAETNSVNQNSFGITGFFRKRTATLTSKSKPSDNNGTLKQGTTTSSSFTSSLSIVAFETLLFIVKGICLNSKADFYERDAFLSSYIYYLFKIPPTSASANFCLLLCERWEDFFKACHSRETEKRAKETTTQTITTTSMMDGSNTTTSDNSKDSSSKKSSKRSSKSRSTSSNNNENSESTGEDELTALDSLKLSWFLFDVLVKAMKFYILNGQKDAVFTEAFYTKMRSIQTKFMERLLTSSGDPIKLNFVRAVNRHLALFMCDLLDISLMSSMREDTRFRKFVKTALNDYVLTTQFKSSPVVVALKFDFAEVIVDYNMFVEVNMCSEVPFLMKFIIGIFQKATKPNLREMTVKIINKLITKLDYSTKFQSPEVRNEISRLLQPLFFDIAHVEKLLKNMDMTLQSQFAVSFLHCLRNRKKEDLHEFWNHKSPDVLVSFVKLLSIAINNHISYNVRITRRMIKTIVLEVLTCFIEQKWELMIKENEKYSIVIEEVLLLIMKYMEQFNQTQQDMKKKTDPILTNTILVPLFVTIVQKLVPVFSIDPNDDRWKWALGTLLSVCTFPLSKADNETYVLEAVECLLSSHDEKLAEIEKNHDKLIIEEDSEKNIVIENNEIKAATLDKLVEKITHYTDMDHKFRDIFFLTYRSFCTGHVLMDKLMDRFYLTKQEEVWSEKSLKILIRVLNSMKIWVEKHFHDFDNLLLIRLVRFLDSASCAVKEVEQTCNLVRKSLSSKLIKDNNKAVKHSTNQKAPEPILPENFSEHVAFNLLEWSPIEFARQLTLIEYDYFQKIEPKEWLSGAWTKHTKYEEAPHIAHLTDRWNKMTQFVASAILSQSDMKQRRKYLLKFIEIAQALREMNNYHGLTEMMCGLSNVSVHRLKKTWAIIPPEYISRYEELRKLCSQEQANKNMRQALQLSTPPCIPPLSMYLKDLTFINDGNADNIRDGLINVFKRRQVSKIILETIKVNQNTPFLFETIDYMRRVINQIQTASIEDYKLYTSGTCTIPSIQSMLSLGSVQLMDDDTLWDKSLELEPRNQQQ